MCRVLAFLIDKSAKSEGEKAMERLQKLISMAGMFVTERPNSTKTRGTSMPRRSQAERTEATWRRPAS